jgi:hypothetical protein
LTKSTDRKDKEIKKERESKFGGSTRIASSILSSPYSTSIFAFVPYTFNFIR